ncbi:MAG: hypothetical protein QF570_15400 [Myxococcota bacterium]|jgi:hypothetical protein|nr:hypothetical protein [Myxococcota bacterium]
MQVEAEDSSPELRDLVEPATWPRMRPRFILELDCSADCVMDAMRRGVAHHEKLIEGQFSERHVVLTLPEEELRFWSTYLNITVEDARVDPVAGPRPTRVLGVFQPRPEIWTAYVFAIGILMLIGVFSVMVTVVQLTMGLGAWGLMACLVSALVGGLLYTSTLVGQGLALGEMFHLRRLFDGYIDDARGAGECTPRTAADSAQL